MLIILTIEMMWFFIKKDYEESAVILQTENPEPLSENDI